MEITRAAAPLREQIVEAIRRGITSGEFTPGMRLKEKELVDRFGVSRTVIREALRQLESERLVYIEPNVGPVVVTLTADVARELYEAREALEGAVARLAAERRGRDDIDRLTAMLKELEDAVASGVTDLVLLKDDFYRLLIAVARNQTIGQMLANVQYRISQLRRITLSSPNRGDEMLRELHRIVGAIVDGDPGGALVAAQDHVRAAREIAVGSLE